MQVTEFLIGRNSHPRLIEPAPEGQVMERIYQAALRAPDHAGLTPWRLIEFRNEGLGQLGELFAQAKLCEDPGASIEDLTRLRNMTYRAPLVIAVIAKIQEHPKVPASEQLLSAGCVAHGLLLAAEAEGFAAMWRSGSLCFDPKVKQSLKLNDADELLGFIYMGSPVGRRKALPERKTSDFVEKWT
ncbi:nitroreductase family protein [Marinospirillum insulare]|uniref:Putative NAD(P)H nitroreductase n=1 Tax=Marinospirillum insulare TaxID=217169 RepID=A0ABQ5ZUA5_9GAMM|nr:nitroreductase family protein [Marinospirillum insulare]GLR62625.1 nitroreductase [Marinospirillum insulare]